MVHKFKALRSLAVLLLVTVAALAFNGIVSVNAQNTAAGSAATQSAPAPLSARERVEVFEKVWKTIEEKYYDPSFNGVDWSTVRERYRPRAEATAGEKVSVARIVTRRGSLLLLSSGW